MVALDGLPPLMLIDARKTAIEVHTHLRRLIIDNALPPGTVLKQAELARVFNVSRTPLREAFRMLQEEGLIDAAPNQRGTVRGLDVAEVDHLYAARIALESLGTRISTGLLTPAEISEARQCLADMETAHQHGDMGRWVTVHRRFHTLCMARAGEPLLRTITSYSERSERFLRLYQLWHPQSFSEAYAEHSAIFDAVNGTNPAAAGALMAQHLARTALTVLADLSSETGGQGVRQAVAMVCGTRPVVRRDRV